MRAADSPFIVALIGAYLVRFPAEMVFENKDGRSRCGARAKFSDGAFPF